jgi:hypothetical protein
VRHTLKNKLQNMEKRKNSYLNEFQDRYKEKFKKEYAPTQVIEVWRELVDACIEGYSYSVFDFSNDLFVRELVEFGLTEGNLSKYEEHQTFKQKIKEIDDDFLKIIRESTYPKDQWWKDAILKYSGEKYSSDMSKFHGISIPVLGK